MYHGVTGRKICIAIEYRFFLFMPARALGTESLFDRLQEFTVIKYPIPRIEH